MGNLFISWSGARAERMAKILYEWIPQVIQAVEPWLSGSDIDKGARWNEELAEELDHARLGIFCLTPENRNAPWLLFEAGALSKTIGSSLVCTYLLDLKPADVQYPLAQFNATRAEKEETGKLIVTINKALGQPVKSEKTLEKAFETYWPELERQLAAITKPAETRAPRDEKEMIQEILILVRSLAQRPDVAVEPTRDRGEAYYVPTIGGRRHTANGLPTSGSEVPRYYPQVPAMPESAETKSEKGSVSEDSGPRYPGAGRK